MESTLASQLTLTLNGLLQDMEPRTVADAITYLTAMAKSLSPEVSAPRMGILAEGSVVAGILVGPEVAQDIKEGVEHVRHTGRLPKSWSYRTAYNLEKLTKLSSKGGCRFYRSSLQCG